MAHRIDLITILQADIPLRTLLPPANPAQAPASSKRDSDTDDDAASGEEDSYIFEHDEHGSESQSVDEGSVEGELDALSDTDDYSSETCHDGLSPFPRQLLWLTLSIAPHRSLPKPVGPCGIVRSVIAATQPFSTLSSLVIEAMTANFPTSLDSTKKPHSEPAQGGVEPLRLHVTIGCCQRMDAEPGTAPISQAHGNI